MYLFLNDPVKSFQMFIFEKPGFLLQISVYIQNSLPSFLFLSHFSRSGSPTLIFASLWEGLLSCLVQVGGFSFLIGLLPSPGRWAVVCLNAFTPLAKVHGTFQYMGSVLRPFKILWSIYLTAELIFVEN